MCGGDIGEGRNMGEESALSAQAKSVDVSIE